jgi:hypothetical protein
MNTTRNIAIAIAAALTGLFAVSQGHAAPAAQEVALLAMKPLQALTFERGGEHIVSYYLSDNGRCRLYVTRAADSGETHSFIATRYELVIQAGKATRFASEAGNAYEFACASGALAMNVSPLERLASR